MPRCTAKTSTTGKRCTRTCAGGGAVCWQHVDGQPSPPSQKAAHAAAKTAPLRSVTCGGEDDGDICAICLMGFDDEGKEKKTVVLQCDHSFHTECVNEWFEKDKDTCPICRAQVSQNVLKRVAPAVVARAERHAMQRAFLLRLLLEAAGDSLPENV